MPNCRALRRMAVSPHPIAVAALLIAAFLVDDRLECLGEIVHR